MIEHNFKNSCEFARWKVDKEIYNMEYLGTMGGRENQNCFEVDIENEDTQLVFIDKSANELFFGSRSEMNEWFNLNNASDITNNGLSDVYSGFNVFQCLVDEIRFTVYIDALALIK